MRCSINCLNITSHNIFLMEKTYLTQQEFRNRLLDMLIVFDKFCKENNLKYSLGGGTFLGAIRHKGFIPWDDDLDLMMHRKDYDFVKKHFNSYSKHYKTIYAEVSKDVIVTAPFLKIHDTRTQVYEGEAPYGKTGIYLDIFPIDGVPTNMKKCKRFIYFSLYVAQFLMYKNRPWNLSKHPDFIIKKVVGSLLPAKIWGYIIDKIISHYSYDSCDYAATVTGRYAMTEVYPKYIYDSFEEAVFEGYKFPILKEYDAYLKQHYGDYMSLPPEDKRVNHQSKAWLLQS